MKGQRVNPNNLNPMEMNNMSAMAGMLNTMQRIGKSKRKYTVKLDKASKKFLVKFLEEIMKQFDTNAAPQQKNVVEFLNYVKAQCEMKDREELRLSFEELEFMKRMVADSIKGMEGMQFKWYQFIKKGMMKTMLVQYKNLSEALNK